MSDDYYPLDMRGNKVACDYYDRTRALVENQANENLHLRERLRLAESEVSHLKSVLEVARAEGFRAGVEAAAKLMEDERPIAVAKWKWDARIESIRSLSPERAERGEGARCAEPEHIACEKCFPDPMRERLPADEVEQLRLLRMMAGQPAPPASGAPLTATEVQRRYDEKMGFAQHDPLTCDREPCPNCGPLPQHAREMAVPGGGTKTVMLDECGCRERRRGPPGGCCGACGNAIPDEPASGAPCRECPYCEGTGLHRCRETGCHQEGEECIACDGTGRLAGSGKHGTGGA